MARAIVQSYTGGAALEKPGPTYWDLLANGIKERVGPILDGAKSQIFKAESSEEPAKAEQPAKAE